VGGLPRQAHDTGAGEELIGLNKAFAAAQDFEFVVRSKIFGKARLAAGFTDSPEAVDDFVQMPQFEIYTLSDAA